MDAHWNILSYLSTDIQKASAVVEVTQIWFKYLIFLRDCKLIYSHQEESDIVLPSNNWPRNFPKGGFLRPLFAHDNVYFLNRRIAEEQRFDLVSPVRVDTTLEFDTNVASYIEGFVENIPNSNPEGVRDILDFVIRTDRANFAYNFYAWENSQGFYEGSRVSSIRRNLRSIMKLDYLDYQEYLKKGVVRATISDQELDVKAEEKLQALYDPTNSKGLMSDLLPVNEMIYLILLKIVEIEHRDKRRKLDLKIEELYQFLHFDLKTLFVREVIMALHYFKNRSELTFFGKFINLRRKEQGQQLLKDLKNMSWDLMLFRVMERMATLPGQGDFLIPYFLSFDKKMVELFDLFPLRAILAYGDAAQMVPIWETAPLEELNKDIDIEYIKDYFSETASNIRQTERRLDPRPDFNNLKQNLEEEVIRLLTY